jgi:predicted DNA-binding protein
MHTAEHLLNQTMVRMFDCGRCVSAHLNRKKSKCDYAFSRDITDEEKAAIEERLNRLIADDLGVREEVLHLDDAGELCDLSRLPDESGETVRTVRLPETLSQRLTVLSNATKRTKSHFIRESLERTLEDLEDAYLAETAYEDFMKSGEKSISLEDVERDLDLAD